MKKKLVVLFVLLSFAFVALAPLGVSAQVTVVNPQTCGTGGGGINNIKDGICKVGELLNTLIPVLITLGVVYFVYGVITYVIASDEEAKKTGRNRIIYGIIGLAVIVAVWGLVGILRDTFVPQGNTGNIALPTITN